jgi:hypothetical protein
MIKALYEKLNSSEFLVPGGISYNFYILPYDVRNEGKVLSGITNVLKDLKRPADYIDVLAIDLFKVFTEFLSGLKLGNTNYLDHLVKADSMARNEYGHSNITKILSEKAHCREFLNFVHAKVVTHFGKDDPQHKRPYLFLYGMGAMFPYLRTNEFLTAYEAVNDANLYKVIVLYPGAVQDGRFSLFGVLDDPHAYRAQMLQL